MDYGQEPGRLKWTSRLDVASHPNRDASRVLVAGFFPEPN